MAKQDESTFHLLSFQFKWPWEKNNSISEKNQLPFHVLHSIPSRLLNSYDHFRLGNDESSTTHHAEFELSRNRSARSIIRRNRFQRLRFSSPQDFKSSFMHLMHTIHNQAIQSPIDNLSSNFNNLFKNINININIKNKNVHPFENFFHAISNKLINLNNERSLMPLLASISSSISKPAPLDAVQEAQNLKTMTPAQISKRLDGVPVYAVSNYSNEFVLVSDINSNKSLGIFCFRQEDAEALLAQVKDREPSLGRGARVVSVSLDKVYQLNAEGIAFRFLPDPRQVKHALEETKKLGDSGKGFDGVPIFLSDNLILKIKSQRLCPIFFSKEDLENALQKAISQQQRTNPNLRIKNEIQVGSFEDVLKKMESNEEESEWGNIVFIPLGMDAKNFLERSAISSRGN